MIEAAFLTAASDVVLAVAVAIPLALAGGGVAIATRRRGSAGKSTTAEPIGSGAGTAVVEPMAVSPIAPVDTTPAVEPTSEVEPEAASYQGRLGKARGLLSGYIGAVRARGKIDATTWDDLEEALIRADVGVGATDAVLDDLRGRVTSGEIGGPDALVDALKADLVAMLTTDNSGLAEIASVTADGTEYVPSDGEVARTVDVWLFVGVNGVGKTTTLGKVATRLSRTGTPVLLAAGDTFRAAAAEQLGLWAERAGADIVRGAEGGDPSSVVFDAVQRAASRAVSYTHLTLPTILRV